MFVFYDIPSFTILKASNCSNFIAVKGIIDYIDIENHSKGDNKRISQLNKYLKEFEQEIPDDCHKDFINNSVDLSPAVCYSKYVLLKDSKDRKQAGIILYYTNNKI